MLRVVAKLHRTVNAVRTNAEFPWMTMARALTRFAACALAFIFLFPVVVIVPSCGDCGHGEDCDAARTVFPRRKRTFSLQRPRCSWIIWLA